MHSHAAIEQAEMFRRMKERATTFPMFAALAFVILLCYGGGFGTMPAFAADYFGTENVGSIYGLILTAWGFAGLVGPILIASIRQRTGAYSEALVEMSYIVLVSAIIPLIVRPPKAEQLQRRELAA